MPPRIHLYTLIPMMVSGVFGAFCVLAVNSWMNAPSGFRLVGGKVVDVDPLAAMFNKALPMQFLHMLLAAYMVTGFLVASVYADRDAARASRSSASPRLPGGVRRRLGRLRDTAGGRTHRGYAPRDAAAREAGGDGSGGRHKAERTTDNRRRSRRWASARGNRDSRRRFDISRAPDSTDRCAASDDFAVDDRPPVNIVHWSFQSMVALGTALALGRLVFWFRRRRGHDPFSSRWTMRLAMLAGPASVLTLELGWITTEVGRQPWMVYRVLRVRDAVTDNDGVYVSLATLVVVYAGHGRGRPARAAQHVGALARRRE